MTQNTKKQSKLWILLVSILVIAAIVVGLVFILRPNSNAVATMQCNVNPSVQFVLNSQNSSKSLLWLLLRKWRKA